MDNILENIDPKVLGSRLYNARKASGLTQQAVADQIGIARTTLVAIEKGDRRLSAHELIALAHLYGRPVSEFVSRSIIADGFVPQFRHGWGKELVEDSDLENIAAELQQRAEDYVQLEQLCGISTNKSFPPRYNYTGLPAEQVAEEIATAERNRLGIGDGPISNLRKRLQ